MILGWSSYDRVWFPGPDKQEIFILMILESKVQFLLTKPTKTAMTCLPFCVFVCLYKYSYSDAILVRTKERNIKI
jgi:hypothetical protein